MDSFAKILRREREKSGLLLRQVAAKLDIDQALISKFEKGERQPTREQVESLASIYQIDCNELIISWKSDKIVYDLSNEDNSIQILKIAEMKIRYRENNYE